MNTYYCDKCKSSFTSSSKCRYFQCKCCGNDLTTEYKVVATCTKEWSTKRPIMKATFENKKDAEKYQQFLQSRAKNYNVTIEKCTRQHIIIVYDIERMVSDNQVKYEKYYFDNNISQSDFEKQIAEIFDNLNPEHSCKRIINKIISRFTTLRLDAALTCLSKYTISLHKFKHFYNSSPDDVLHFFEMY